MHLKVLIRYFQKMALFIMLWLSVWEILVFEVKQFWYISAESAFFYILIADISWTVFQTPVNYIIF